MKNIYAPVDLLFCHLKPQEVVGELLFHCILEFLNKTVPKKGICLYYSRHVL